MRRALRLVLPLLATLASCGGPLGIIPGGELSGSEATASAWNEVVSESGTLDLETRPEDPYSARIGFVLCDGKVYIDPAEERGWYQHLKANLLLGRRVVRDSHTSLRAQLFSSCE